MSIASVLSRSPAKESVQPTRLESQRQRLKVAFEQSVYPALRRIEYCWDRGVLRLWGQVGSYFLKQMAQEHVYRALGPCELCNEIEVRNPDSVL